MTAKTKNLGKSIKVPLDRISLAPSWMIETSKNNFQIGFILAEPITDAAEADRLLLAIIDAGLTDPGASGPCSRLGRLPVAINGKHKNDSGIADCAIGNRNAAIRCRASLMACRSSCKNPPSNAGRKAESELAKTLRHYQRGGIIVTITTALAHGRPLSNRYPCRA